MNKIYQKSFFFKKNPAKGHRSGFTLIELLVVVLVIGILSAIALPQYQKSVMKARIAEAKIGLKTLVEAIDLYILETGEAPTSFQDLSIELPSSSTWRYYFGKCTYTGSLGCHIVATPIKPDSGLPQVRSESRNYAPSASLYGQFEISLASQPLGEQPAVCAKYGGQVAAYPDGEKFCSAL